MESSLQHLLLRSQQFEDALTALLPDPPTLADSTDRVELAAASCIVSTQHALAARAAFQVGAPTSAAALLRLQFEALVRSAWILYAAPASQVDMLSQELTVEAEWDARKTDGMADMMDAVSKKAPLGLSVPLGELYASSRHALNSFVHTGIHALHRSRHGFPVEIAEQLLRLSNGLLHLGYRMLATLSGSPALMNSVTGAWKGFVDCLPADQRHRGEGTAP